ncbi:hypothetical protein Cni_G06014 [Canna indica]|uniref:Uncharacterized protein n=1 Tax=Canna indica TaxID=4628 RepID=A0AAQ3JW70_9LILI|nr:hypothetical protein Cni_G06014 [Canna indica]
MPSAPPPRKFPPHSMRNASVRCARDSDEEADEKIQRCQGGDGGRRQRGQRRRRWRRGGDRR